MIELSSQDWPQKPNKLLAVILDWAGTTVDFGSRAPVEALLATFERRGVRLTEDEARRSMGKAKQDHIRDLLNLPSVAEKWAVAHGRRVEQSDAEVLFKEFLHQQLDIVVEHSAIIRGCPEAVRECRQLGLRIGSSTGYSRTLLAAVAKRAKEAGYEPDVMLCADDVSPGRPAPWLCFENARRLGVYPMSSILKVDDTPAGIAAGRNAGTWTVGIVASGNEVGLTYERFESLSQELRTPLLDRAQSKLASAGAHFLIDTIAELPAVVARVNHRIADGELP
jgi:phosphonoacetaldehyde hydrolase